MLNVFITGSDINVGKTFITAGLAATMQSLGYDTCVYKPVQTGASGTQGFMQSHDLVYVKTIDPYIKTFSTYLFKEAANPVIASEMENIKIDRNFIKQDYETSITGYDCAITDGTGGIMTPIAPNFLVSDIINLLDLPAVVVIKPDSSTINHTLLTLNHAESKGIKIRGVIINGFPENTDNIDMKTAPRLIEEYSNAKILGIVKNFKDVKRINPNDLITTILNGIDIESVFDVRIEKLDVE